MNIERGGILKKNLIKTEFRNLFTTEALNDLMLISHYLPKNLKDFDPISTIQLHKSQNFRRLINEQ